MEEYDPDIEFEPEVQAAPRARIDPALYQHYVDLRRSKQHLPFGIVGAAVGGALGAAAWLGIVMFTNLQANWAPVAVGFLAGGLMRVTGKGFDRIFGAAGALLAALGCAAGQLLTGCWFVAAETEDATLTQIVSAITPGFAIEIFKVTYAPADAIFYGIALIAAFRISYRRISRSEKALVMTDADPAHAYEHSDAA
jgi:hypothetical protein